MAAPVDFTRLPKHVAIIMDGNRRYAKSRRLPVKAGHAVGAQNLRKLARRMNQLGFKCLTVYAFSTENWTRNPEEVEDLMELFTSFIKQYTSELEHSGVRIRVIGERSRLRESLREAIEGLEAMTADYTGMALNIAINYSGRDELTRAMRRIAADGLPPGSITEDTVTSYLDTAASPPLDLLIRTGGEYRLSNFLLWQAAYAELYFSEALWPSFSEEDLLQAVSVYQSRERKFGK